MIIFKCIRSIKELIGIKMTKPASLINTNGKTFGDIKGKLKTWTEHIGELFKEEILKTEFIKKYAIKKTQKLESLKDHTKFQ